MLNVAANLVRLNYAVNTVNLSNVMCKWAISGQSSPFSSVFIIMDESREAFEVSSLCPPTGHRNAGYRIWNLLIQCLRVVALKLPYLGSAEDW